MYPPGAAILLVAKGEWGGGNVLGSWDASKPCKEWDGVECDASGRVAKLDLTCGPFDAFSSAGSIPSSLGDRARGGDGLGGGWWGRRR